MPIGYSLSFHILSRGNPIHPIDSFYLPDTDVLVLLGQVLTPVKVVGLHHPRGLSEEILCAARGSQVVVVTGVLSDLEKKIGFTKIKNKHYS